MNRRFTLLRRDAITVRTSLVNHFMTQEDTTEEHAMSLVSIEPISIPLRTKTHFIHFLNKIFGDPLP